MLRKYSHFSDLQATDEYQTNSTIGCMLKLNRACMHPPPLPIPPRLYGSLQLGEEGGLKISGKSLPGERGQSEIFIWVRVGEGGYIV